MAGAASLTGLADATLKTLLHALKDWSKPDASEKRNIRLATRLMRRLQKANTSQLAQPTNGSLLTQNLLGTGPNPSQTALENFFQEQLDGSIPTTDSISVADNISALLLPEFGPPTDVWSPLQKTYEISTGATLDAVALIASPMDANGDVRHLCSYAFAINHTSTHRPA